MKRRYVVTGLGLIAVLALVTTAIAGGGIGSGAHAAKKARRGPAGPAGPQGPQGNPGTNGTDGTNGTNGATNVVVRTASLVLPEGVSASVDAPCVGNERATGGGYSFSTGNSTGNMINSDSPPTGSTTTPPTSWRVAAFNPAPSATDTYTIYVICASP
jgi:hypothetical protein